MHYFSKGSEEIGNVSNWFKGSWIYFHKEPLKIRICVFRMMEMAIALLTEHQIRVWFRCDNELHDCCFICEVGEFEPTVEVVIVQVIHGSLTELLRVILDIHPEDTIVFLIIVVEFFADSRSPLLTLITPVSLPFHASPRVSYLNQSCQFSFLSLYIRK